MSMAVLGLHDLLRMLNRWSMKLGWTPTRCASFRPEIFLSGSGPTNDLSRSALINCMYVPLGQRRLGVVITIPY